MPHKVPAPEAIVTVEAGAFGVPLNDAEIVIIGGYHPAEPWEENAKTPQARYAELHLSAVLNIVAAQNGDTWLPDDNELELIKTNAERWQRITVAATRLLGSRGYFPPVTPPSEQGAVIPLQRTQSIAHSHDAGLRASA